MPEESTAPASPVSTDDIKAGVDHVLADELANQEAHKLEVESRTLRLSNDQVELNSAQVG